MLDAVIAWVEARDATMPISLSVNPAFRAAVRLYESRGFKATGASEPIEHAPQARCAIMVRAIDAPG